MQKLLILFLFFLTTKTSFSQKWESLFDGKTLKGWTVVDPPVDVKIKDSSLVLRKTPNTRRHAFIRTNQKYEDFIVELEFQRDLTMDSGVLFRSIDAPDSSYSGLWGYMVKIDPQVERRWTGGIFVDFGNGFQWLQTLENQEEARKAERKTGEWNTLRIEVIGQKISVFLNGIPTTNLTDDKYSEGYIAFKFHFLIKDSEQPKSEIAFKNIRILTSEIEKYRLKNTLPMTDTRGFWKIKYFR
jgi:Domain of Unknown Function (DUF1080)